MDNSDNQIRCNYSASILNNHDRPFAYILWLAFHVCRRCNYPDNMWRHVCTCREIGTKNQFD